MPHRPPYSGVQYNGYGDPYRQQPPPILKSHGGGYPPQSRSTMFPPHTDRAIVEIFDEADRDRSGTIDERELGTLLSQGRVAFSPRTLRLMLHLFADTPDTSRIGRQGFVRLWHELGVWHSKFLEYDRDRSGTIDKLELQQALLSFHFAIPPQVLDLLVRKYDRSGHNQCIVYGDFVECGFIVKGLTEKFKCQDWLQDGTATFDYTGFMLMVIPFIAA